MDIISVATIATGGFASGLITGALCFSPRLMTRHYGPAQPHAPAPAAPAVYAVLRAPDGTVPAYGVAPSGHLMFLPGATAPETVVTVVLTEDQNHALPLAPSAPREVRP